MGSWTRPRIDPRDEKPLHEVDGVPLVGLSFYHALSVQLEVTADRPWVAG
jgi:hypothetical protein